MYHLHIYLWICSGQIYFISYSTPSQLWSFYSNFKVVFFYTSKTKPHLWSVPSLKINSWTVKKALGFVTQTLKKLYLPLSTLTKTDKYTGFLHFPFTRHKNTGEGAIPRFVLFHRAQHEHRGLSALSSTALLTKQQMMWNLTYDPGAPETTGGLPPPRNSQQTRDCQELSQSLIFQDIKHTQLICLGKRILLPRWEYSTPLKHLDTWPETSDTMRHHWQRLFF